MAIKVDTRLIKRHMKNSRGFVTIATANDAYIGNSRSENILKNEVGVSSANERMAKKTLKVI